MKILKLLKLLILLCLFIQIGTLSSCSIQKKRYSKGFHVTWKNQKIYQAESMATSDTCTNSKTESKTPIEAEITSQSIEKKDFKIKTSTTFIKPQIQKRFKPQIRKINLGKLKKMQLASPQLSLTKSGNTSTKSSSKPEENIPLLLLSSSVIAILYLVLISLSLLLPIAGIYIFLGLVLLSNPLFNAIDPDDDNFWGKSLIWARIIVASVFTIAIIVALAIILPLITFISLIVSTILCVLFIAWLTSSILDGFFNLFN